MSNDKDDDSEFIVRFRNGNIDAFNDVYRMYYNAIYLFANALIHSEMEAQDIVTESFVKLWRLHPNLESLANIKAFLYLTTRNACFDHLRHLKRHNASYKEVLYLSKESPNDVEFEIIKADYYNEIALQIENLPKQCAEVFKLIFFKGKKTFEIAEHLGISNKTVLAHKRNAIINLRSALLRKSLLTLILLTLLPTILSPLFLPHFTNPSRASNYIFIIF